MRRVFGSLLVAAVVVIPSISSAQDETSRAVAGGGVSVAGWTGRVDANEAARGGKLTDAKLTGSMKELSVTTGPATTYWNPANKASGNYTVKATFNEPKFQNLSPHPHPYGIVIAGNDMGTPGESFLYCAAYGNGSYIMRGFGQDASGASKAFQMDGRNPVANDAIHKAAGVGQPVSQEIAIQVKPDAVDCIINGKVVGTYPKANLVTAGKLKSTDGVYGIRFAHNTEATVTGLTMTKN